MVVRGRSVPAVGEAAGSGDVTGAAGQRERKKINKLIPK